MDKGGHSKSVLFLTILQSINNFRTRGSSSPEAEADVEAAPEVLRQEHDDLNQSRDMFEETFALDEPQEEEALHTPAHNMDDEQPLLEDPDPDTDSASEDDTNRYGLKPFLLAKFKDQTMDIQGDAF